MKKFARLPLRCRVLRIQQRLLIGRHSLCFTFVLCLPSVSMALMGANRTQTQFVWRAACQVSLWYTTMVTFLRTILLLLWSIVPVCSCCLAC